MDIDIDIDEPMPWSESLWEFDRREFEAEGPDVIKSIFTCCEAITMLVYIFVKYGIPRDARRAIFDVIKMLLPESNTMPRHTEVEYKIRESHDIDYKRYGTCPSNCCVASNMSLQEFDELLQYSTMPGSMLPTYRQYFEHAIVSESRKTCPHCSLDLKTKNKGEYTNKYCKEHYEIDIRKKVQQLYKDRTFVEQANISNKHTEHQPGKDIYTSPEWKEKVLDRGLHLNNRGRDLVLCFLADGICPFSRRKQHTMDAQGFYIMNLPKQYRINIRNILLSGITAGPEKVVDQQPYLLLLVIQLLQIEKEGGVLVEDIDNPGNFFRVRLHVLWTLGDLPAVNKIWNWNGGYSGCCQCRQKGQRKHGRMVWGEYQHAHPPRDPAQVLQDSITARELERLGSKADIDSHAQTTGTKGIHVLSILGLSPVTSGLYDFMHVLKGVFVHTIYTLKGKRAPKAAANMTQSELQALDENLAAVVQDLQGVSIPESVQKRIDARQNRIDGPARYVVRGKGLFGHSGQWKIREQQNFWTSSCRYLFNGMFQGPLKQMWTTFTAMFAALAAGLTPVTTSAQATIKDLVQRSLVLWETVMPETEHALIIHLIRHLIFQKFRMHVLIDCYPWERFCGWLGRLISKTSQPEVNAMNAYSAFLWVTSTLNVLDLANKLSSINSQGNHLVCSDMITDLFDIAGAAATPTKPVDVFMPFSHRQFIVSQATRSKVNACLTRLGYDQYTILSVERNQRARFKGKLLGVSGSLARNSWIQTEPGNVAQALSFLRVNLLDQAAGEQREVLMVEAKLLTNTRVSVDTGECLYNKRPAVDSPTVLLITDIIAQMALGLVRCPEFPTSDTPPEDHDEDCLSCLHLPLLVTKFDNY